MRTSDGSDPPCNPPRTPSSWTTRFVTQDGQQWVELRDCSESVLGTRTAQFQYRLHRSRSGPCLGPPSRQGWRDRRHRRRAFRVCSMAYLRMEREPDSLPPSGAETQGATRSIPVSHEQLIDAELTQNYDPATRQNRGVDRLPTEQLRLPTPSTRTPNALQSGHRPMALTRRTGSPGNPAPPDAQVGAESQVQRSHVDRFPCGKPVGRPVGGVR